MADAAAGAERPRLRVPVRPLKIRTIGGTRGGTAVCPGLLWAQAGMCGGVQRVSGVQVKVTRRATVGTGARRAAPPADCMSRRAHSVLEVEAEKSSVVRRALTLNRPIASRVDARLGRHLLLGTARAAAQAELSEGLSPAPWPHPTRPHPRTPPPTHAATHARALRCTSGS